MESGLLERGAMSDAHDLFLLSSSRPSGNTEQLARRAATGLPENAVQTWVDLRDHALPPFEDIRHSAGEHPQPEGSAQILLEATLAATDLVLVAPLYWYTLPTLAKRYLDEWSAWMRVPDLNFKTRMAGKNLHLITVHTGDRTEVEPLIGAVRLTADDMKMHFSGTLIGWGSRPGDVLKDEQALSQATAFFRKDHHD